MKLKVFPSLYEESKEGWVWIPEDTSLNSEFIKIENKMNKKSIACEKRILDNNYIARYTKQTGKEISKEDSIVINEFYRNKLCVEKNQKYDFNISNVRGFFYKYIKSSLDHPNAFLRLSLKVSLISVLLGILSMLLGILSLVLALTK